MTRRHSGALYAEYALTRPSCLRIALKYRTCLAFAGWICSALSSSVRRTFWILSDVCSRSTSESECKPDNNAAAQSTRPRLDEFVDLMNRGKVLESLLIPDNLECYCLSTLFIILRPYTCI
ncbi:hypothetical protein BDW22DRAFT_1357944 [Trametopsis cervina]|nr:hypothetical protein BDW22DRAFT_1357944 [Trametopsis cervina]